MAQNSDVLFADSEQSQIAIGHNLAQCCQGDLMIYLEGNLGAGKTTFAKGFLRGLGYQGHVKSPTYTLLETYQTAQFECHHLDLYRLADPEELEYIGFRDLLNQQALFLVEWADKGLGVLPLADLIIKINYQAQGREIHLISQNHQAQEIINLYHTKFN